MREIEFRAKRIDNGEWVYGSLVVETYPDFCCYYIRTKDEEDWTSRYMDVPVDKETVGQYTGLEDKNGKKIFEGDIVSSNRSGGRVVEYNDEYGIWEPFGDNDLWSFEPFNMEVVGTIYDNPELIKK